MDRHGVSSDGEPSPLLDLRVLEAVAEGQPLAAVLSLIACGLEELVVGWRVAVLLVSTDGTTLHHSAAPSLPEGYVRAVDGEHIAPIAGSCGTSVYRRAVVFVEDIDTDPLWAANRELALLHGLRACWSIPVLGAEGTVLAALAVYHTAPARPERADLEVVERFVRLVRAAIQHDRAQQDVRASEERFRTALSDAALGVAIADRSGRFIYCNPAFERLLGYSCDERLRLTIDEVAHPDDRDRLLALLDDLYAGTRDSFAMETRYVARDGRVLWVRLSVSTGRDAEGRVTETIALADDITQEREAERERQQQQSLLHMALHVGRLGAWSFEVATRQLHLSEELRAIHELAPGETPDNEALLSTFAPEHQQALRAGITACVERGATYDEEARLTTRRGTTKWVRAIGQPVEDERGQVVRVQGTLQDITDRKRLEQQSLRSQRLESIGTLAGGIAHDLNNVLTPIAMGVGILKSGERDVNRLQVLDLIEQSAARAANMVRQVLSFARGAEGRRTRVPPASLVGDVEALLADTLPKQIRLDTHVAADAWTVDVDATQLHQVLLNLCVNARDAMPNGGVLRITAYNVSSDRTTPHGPRPDRRVCISVEDTGEGIAAEVVDKIFDPFFTTKPVGQGTGLGLATSLGIVHSHGGSIDVTSTPGVGSRFDVLLPAATDGAPQAESRETTHEDARGHGTILLVDDEPAVRLVSRHVLQRNGYRVLEAADGDDALALLSRHQHDIAAIVTDMMMPRMDGAALIRAIRAMSTTIPIIGMSGIGIADRLSTSEVAGLSGFLQKPYAPEALLAAVRRALHAADDGTQDG